MEGMSNPAAEVVRLCSELIRIDTSNYGPGERAGERVAAEYIAAELDEVGIASELFESEPGRATLVANWEPDGCDKSVPPLLVHGHTDVVPATAADWRVDPFAGEVVDDCVWGRGAVDMKDFDAMVLAVVRDRVRTGRPPRRPIRLVITADEEAGSQLGAIWLVNNHPETVADCSEAIGEVGGFSLTVRDDLRLYLIQTAEKGLHWMRLVASGTAGHGSMVHPDNAVTTLARAIANIGSHSWPRIEHPTVQRFLSEISEAFETDFTTGDIESNLARLGSVSRMIGATLSNTVNPTMLNAGYKVNVIPGQATAQIDGRFLPGHEDELLATVRELVGQQVAVETVTREDAVETEFAGALADAMRASLQAEDAGARAVPFVMSAGTDAKAWHRLGITCFGFAPLQLPPDLDFAGLFHGVDERVPVSALEFGCRVLDRFLDLA